MEIAILLTFFLLNGLFAMSEMSVVSSRKPRLTQWADEGKPGAKAALELADDPGLFLSTIQVGITVIGVLSGAFGEATLAGELAGALAQWPWLAPYAEQTALAVVVIGITFCSLIIGELVPKRLALRRPEAIASAIARPMQRFSAISYPIVRFLNFVTEAVLKLFGAQSAKQPPVTEEEIRVLMTQGTEAGVFQLREERMVSRVFRMDEERIASVMTPRLDIAYLDIEDSVDETRRKIVDTGHTRFPLCAGGIDNVVGVVHTRTLLKDLLDGKALHLRERAHPPLYLPGSLTLTDLLEAFRRERRQMALVLDEYGEIEGLVTLNDIVEGLVGGMDTAPGAPDADIVRRENGSWLVDGATSVHRFREVVDLDEQLPGEDEGIYDTLGGFMMAALERVPRVGDRVRAASHEFEIMDMDRNRVDRILVTPTAPAPQAERPE